MSGFSYRIFFYWGGRTLRHFGDFGGVSHRNHTFRDYRVELTKFQLSKCNARIHTGFCVGGGEGGYVEVEVVVEADIGGRW